MASHLEVPDLIEPWLLFSIGTIICYGTAQQFSKRGVQLIGVFQTGIIYAVASISIQTGYWLLRPDDVAADALGILVAVAAGVIGALGFVFYVQALKLGKVSIVAVITAGYPAVAVVLGILLLKEVLGVLEMFGISLIVLAIIMLALPRREKLARDRGAPASKMWLFWSFLSFIFWGIWAIPSKVAIEMIGEADFIFIDGLTMVIVWLPLWMVMEKGRFVRDIRKIWYSGTAGVLASIGTVSLFLAFANGQVSIVTPLTSVYPIFTILLARLIIKEHLFNLQYFAIAVALSGTILIGI